jgi:phosphatidylglycerol:prolipoprotein diacylglycerol transferase
MAIGRLGCFAAGCCYGVATQSWLGLYLRDETGAWYTRYPTQLMSAGADLLIFFVLLFLEQWNRRRVYQSAPPFLDGYIFLTFVVLYGAKRFFIQFLRYDYAPLLGPLDPTQLICLAGLLLAASWYGVLLLRDKAALALTAQEP